ncbi:MAG TPA: hypothetical protein PLW70_00370 [Bacteroidales bacterium]|nr:hypothetical protein [Bacteroidales bacterium]
MKSINFSVLIYLSLIIFSSCHGGQKYPESDTWQSYLRDMLPGPMIRTILSDSLEATIPIQIKDINNKKLVNAVFIISRNDSSIYLKSNGSGLVFITLNHAILSENPMIKIQYNGLKAKNIRCSIGGKTVVFEDGKSVNSEVIEFENIPYVEREGFKLYYTIDKHLAMENLTEFLNIIETIKHIMGKSKVLNIFPLLKYNNNISVIGEPEGVNILPININSWRDKYWHFVHETVEYDLIGFNNLYEENPQLRFIGDGLAEYVSLQVLNAHNVQFANEMKNSRIHSLKKSNSEKFSLYDWNITSELIEAYSYSLAFWIKLEKDTSPKKIQDFILLFNNLKTYQQEDIVKLFETVFGKNVSLNITKDEAINILLAY